MSEWSDTIKGGGIVAGVVAILHAVKPFILRKRNTEADRVYHQQFWKELNNDYRIKDVIAEQRDKEILEKLKELKEIRLEELQMIKEYHMEMLRITRQTRDIVREIGLRSGVQIRHFEEGQ